MIVHCAGVAQSAERILGKDKVTGSIPVTSSIHGGIAQLARAIGSYPVCPRFKSVCRHHLTSRCEAFFVSNINLYNYNFYILDWDVILFIWGFYRVSYNML